MNPDEAIINRYAGCDVDILYLTDNSAYHDRGRLEEADERWISLRKPSNELFLVPISAIRLIKIVELPQDRDSLLLRPAEPARSHERLSSGETNEKTQELTGGSRT